MSKTKVQTKAHRKAPPVEDAGKSSVGKQAGPETAARSPSAAGGAAHAVLRAPEEGQRPAQARHVATLQRAVGNAGVGRLMSGGPVQAKLKVSKTGDTHEREAEGVADRVASGQKPPPVDRFVGSGARRAAEQEEPAQADHEEEEAQTVGEEEEKPAQTMGEEEEKPAQAAAEEEEKPAQTVGEEEEKPAQAAPEEEEKPAQAAPEEEQPAQALPIQRAPEDGAAAPRAQRRTSPDDGGTVARRRGQLVASPGGDGNEVDHPGLEARVRAPGGGRPLPPAVRGAMERSTGYGFSGVRVHDGAQDQSDAKRLKAKAFTRGRHIWLGPGQSAGDVELLSHELAHVIQQGAVRKRGKKSAAKKKKRPASSDD